MAQPPVGSEETWTIGRLLAWTADHFKARAVDSPRLSAELLLAQALGCQRIDLYARFTAEPTASQRAAFREMVRAAAQSMPIAYLTGHKEFYSLDFKVTPDVLIPRPETELLVERALAWCEAQPRERFDLLDLGTGCGCIAVAIAKRQPKVYAVASDVSEAALVVAAENARRHGVADRVRCLRADMLDLPADATADGGFDIIISNPPYVAERERDSLPENVRRHEPPQALFGGADGLDAFRRIGRDVGSRLHRTGTLIVEVGYSQADAVTTIFAETTSLALTGRYKDLAGIDRVLQFVVP